MKAYATRIAATGLLVASLGALAGYSALGQQGAMSDGTASNQNGIVEKAFADSQAAFEVNASYAQQNASLSSPNGISIDKQGKYYIVSMDDAKKIFSATVEGKQYSFPCPVQNVLDDGWAYSDSNLWKEAHMEKERTFKPEFGEHMIYLKNTAQSADDYDRTAKEIRVHVNNTSDAQSLWSDCTCVGAAFMADGDQLSNLDQLASFQTGIGINVGDEAQKVIDTFGTWKYYDENSDKQSDKFNICVKGDDGQIVRLGYVNFEQNSDGVITLVNIKVNPTCTSMFS